MESQEIQTEIAAEYSDGSSIVKPSKNFYSLVGKRLLDIVISFVLIILTLPINILLAIATLIDVGFPIFFVQKRVGFKNKIFNIVKFRNMTNQKDENGNLLPASKRVTKFGKFVRKTSLDELLQLYLVFVGKMSIIGPRPLVVEYLDFYSERHKQRHLVKPGLECPPHASNVSIFKWEDKFENDIWYVEHLSFKTDVKMFVMLIRYIFNKKNNAYREAVTTRGDYFEKKSK